MPYRLDPNTGQFVWDGSSIPQTTRDSLGTQIRDLQDQIDNFGFVDLNDAPASYTGQAGKVVAVKSTEDGVEFITNTGGSGSGDVTGPASSTDNAIARFDSTTGKIIQNSSATVSDVGGVSADTFTLSSTPTGAGGTGVLRYDSGEKVAEIGIDGITLKIGTQEYVRVYNATASTLTKGQVVYISGAQGNRVAVQLADASSESTSAGTLGIVAQSITSGAEGFVQTAGSMYSLNTFGLTAGALLYLSETAGEWATSEPAAPAHGVRLAYVERVHATAGSIYIKVDNGYELGELHNITDSVTGATAFLVKNSSTNVWESKNASDSRSALGLGTLATQDGTFSGTSSGTNTGDQTITLTGDVTGSGTGSFAATIASSAVTYAKMQAVSAASRLLGRGTAGTTAVREISLGTGLSMSGDVLSSTVTGIGGSAGLVDNGIVVADGTGGSTVKGSVVSIDSSSGVVSNLTQIRADSSNHSLILSPNGTGALIVGPRPDAGTTGGNARGSNAVDLQFARTSATNVASGQESFIGAGTNNRASNTQSFCIAGSGNQATGTRSGCIGGTGAQATGTDSFTIGQLNQATATAAVACGLQAIANRIGYRTNAYGRFTSSGDAQCGSITVRRQTTDTTQTELTIDGASPTGTTITTSNRIILLASQTVMVDAYIVARSASGTDNACYQRRCLIKRDSANDTVLVGAVQTIGTDIESTGASAWDVTLAADNTNESLQVLVTGAAATNINWFAEIVIREVIRA